jgi:hypothetical protein
MNINCIQYQKNKGFTLIETLVYLALFSLIFVGLFAAGVGIVESLDLLKTKSIVQEEGNFMLAKINWAVVGADNITTPYSANYLELNRLNPDPSMPAKIAIKVDSIDGNNYLVINQDGGGDVPVNSSTVNVANLEFVESAESVKTTFTVNAKTPTGREYTQDFSITNYLRK